MFWPDKKQNDEFWKIYFDLVKSAFLVGVFSFCVYLVFCLFLLIFFYYIGYFDGPPIPNL